MGSGRVVLERRVRAQMRARVAALFLVIIGSAFSAVSPEARVARANAYPAADADEVAAAPNLFLIPLLTKLQQNPVPVSGVCPVQGDLEDKFISSSQMLQYLSCVVPGVEQWIDVVYREMSHPAYFFVPRGVAGGDIAGCDYDENSLTYCLGSQVVYLGEASVWEQYTNFGDAAPVVVIAHEVTHHFQNILEMPRADAPNDQIRYENQADCGAGAFMAYAAQAGMMDPKDDIVDLAGSLAQAGEDEGPDRSHGTMPERLAAFDRAYLSNYAQPMFACIAYVPEVPIISGS